LVTNDKLTTMGAGVQMMTSRRVVLLGSELVKPRGVKGEVKWV
jgi:hypothetical protein